MPRPSVGMGANPLMGSNPMAGGDRTSFAGVNPLAKNRLSVAKNPRLPSPQRPTVVQEKLPPPPEEGMDYFEGL